MNLLPLDKHVMPWRIEDEIKRLGANYIQGGLWRGFASETAISFRVSKTSRVARQRRP
jgi:hypothetical protein